MGFTGMQLDGRSRWRVLGDAERIARWIQKVA
jgi:hypothetical protein